MKAASLLETLVVMAIFSLLIVLTFPFSIRLINQSRADAEVKALSYIIFRQQQDAYSGLKNKNKFLPTNDTFAALINERDESALVGIL